MDLRPGYKLTEIGVIPEDWDVVRLSDLGKFKNGINKSSEAFGHGSPFVNLMDVFGVSSIASSEALGLVDSNSAEQQTYDIRKGDVIFIRSSVKPSGVGLTAVVEQDLPKTVYSGFLIRFRADGSLSNGFKRHCFYEERFRRRVIGASSVSANTNINQDNLKRLLLPLPPTKAEQEAIAEALSDADALIESLEQLLAKKRQVKQGAMQELLTGKKRLPGFSGEWDLHTLGNIATATKGSQLSNCQTSEHGTFAHLNGGMFPSGYTGKSNAPGDTIAVSEGGNSCGYVQFMSAPYWCGGHCYSVVPKGVDNRFLYHALKSEEPSIMGLRVGSGLPNVQKTALLTFELHVPKARHEQTAIAEILSDMDAEITALEAKLAKTRQIKQGMMQELLTGRIRLV